MLVLIGGGGNTGTQLAKMLLNQGYEVHVIEHRIDVLDKLHREIPTEAIVEGYATDVAVLAHAGMNKAQMIAACLEDDASNLVCCFLSRKCFNVPRTIARINNPRNAWLFDQKFHVDSAVNQAEIMAAIIEEEMTPMTMLTLLKLQRGSFSLVEQRITPGAAAIGAHIYELPLPRNSVIAAVLRKGEVIVPRGTTVLEAEDEILAVTDRAGGAELAKLLTSNSNTE